MRQLKKRIKKIGKRIILKFLTPAEINNLINHSKIQTCNNNCNRGDGSKFFPESSVVNLQENNSKIRIGEKTLIRGQLLIFPYGGEISIGNSTYIGDGTRIWSGENISIGSHVLISHNCNILDTNSHQLDYKKRAVEYDNMFESIKEESKGEVKTAPVIIEDNVWISFNVTILKGVRIGQGAIIGAGCVITKDIEPFSVVYDEANLVTKKI